MTTKFKVGITRDVLDSKGEPSFGRAALEALEAAPKIDWEYLPEKVAELTADHGAAYDALYINAARAPPLAFANSWPSIPTFQASIKTSPNRC